MVLEESLVVITFKKSIKIDELRPLLKRLNLDLINYCDWSIFKNTLINFTDKTYWAYAEDGRSLSTNDLRQIESLFADKHLNWIGPVYRMRNTEKIDGLLCPIPNALLIRIARIPNSEERLLQICREYGLNELKSISQYLTEYRYFAIVDLERHNAYELVSILKDRQYASFIRDIKLESMPIENPLAGTPNDPRYDEQWNMDKIGAGGQGVTGWNIDMGSQDVIIAVIDTGVDLVHPDLQDNIVDGVTFDTTEEGWPEAFPGGGPANYSTEEPNSHGTNMAGIAAARINNNIGIAGLAGNCKIMPIAIAGYPWTDRAIANAIKYAVNNGANVVNMSFGSYSWDEGIILSEIIWGQIYCVFCAAAGNNGVFTSNSLQLPARLSEKSDLITVGATDMSDQRKLPDQLEQHTCGSVYGEGLSVMAPGDGCLTTTLDSDYKTTHCTSAATAHVSGLAALLLSEYPSLSPYAVKKIIEKTAEKIGGVQYTQNRTNGTWNEQMGYGRINVHHALDFADVVIRDYYFSPSPFGGHDLGLEPSSPPGGNFWDYSDIVVRSSDDDVFEPAIPAESNRVLRGQTNYIYVRIKNLGHNEARNVIVNVRIVPYAGTQFFYGYDWHAEDAEHIRPTPLVNTFPVIAPGDTAIAKFTVSSDLTDVLWGWKANAEWHPCILAEVISDNDYLFEQISFFSSIAPARLKNNLAQRNLNVINNVIRGQTYYFPFIVGHQMDTDSYMELIIERRSVPKNIQLLLSIDNYDGQENMLPHLKLGSFDHMSKEGVSFLEKAKLEAKIGSRKYVFTAEKGSKIDSTANTDITDIEAIGGRIIEREGRRFVELNKSITELKMRKHPNHKYPFVLHTMIPIDVEEKEYKISITQRNKERETVGGVSVIYDID